MKPHLLVVDDEASVRDFLANYLRKNGYQITTASSAGEAWRAVNEEKFDLVVLDIVMPEEDGLQLLTGLKQFDPTLPVIMLTGTLNDDEVVRDARERGASGFLQKTVPPSRFLEEIRSILGKKSPKCTP